MVDEDFVLVSPIASFGSSAYVLQKGFRPEAEQSLLRDKKKYQKLSLWLTKKILEK
jgi:hypothetical protein